MAKVLIYSGNVIGSSMSGPAIRNWEFAKALSKNHQVVLVGPNTPDIQGEGFECISIQHPKLNEFIKNSNILIAQNLTIPLALKAKKAGLHIIIDAYDPLPLELLELFKDQTLDNQKVRQASAIHQLILNFKMANGIICASEKQRDLWIGFLLAHKLIDPKLYQEDPSLRNYIDVVPFGLSSIFPAKTGPGIREKFNLSPQDKIILWGGGIWNWFDPLTLIHAVGNISKRRQDIKLVFMGLKNPDPTVPEMEMSRQAIELSKQLKILDTHVFFNYGWIPYSERHNFLLDATIGASIHFDHLETKFSFRTRMLDYLWAGLPIIATQGDSFAELIEKENIGSVVPYKDVDSLTKAIVSLIDHPQQMELMRENMEKLSNHYTWANVVNPLNRMINNIKHPQKVNIKDVKCLIKFTSQKIREKGLGECFKILNLLLTNKK
jgi:glycosyltransferase involved in cell wall biosynthesis